MSVVSFIRYILYDDGLQCDPNLKSTARTTTTTKVQHQTGEKRKKINVHERDTFIEKKENKIDDDVIFYIKCIDRFVL